MQKVAEPEEPKTEQTGHTTPHPSDVLDMPVDPNEPTYCVCQQVSYGEMIGCDNTEVSKPPPPSMKFHFIRTIINGFSFRWTISVPD